MLGGFWGSRAVRSPTMGRRYQIGLRASSVAPSHARRLLGQPLSAVRSGAVLHGEDRKAVAAAGQFDLELIVHALLQQRPRQR